MEYVKLWRSGAYSIQKFSSNKVYYDFDRLEWRSYMSANHVNPTYDKNRKPATYPITKKSKLTFMARAFNLADRKKNKYISTQILTYDRLVNNPYEDLNRYLSNLRKNYGLKEYVSALEKTKKGLWHFHLMVDLPYTKVSNLNQAWASARNTDSPNAVRDVRKVRSEHATLKYCAKYLSKDQSKEHDLKKFTYSKGVMGNESQFLDSKAVFSLLKKFREREYDFCWTGNVSVSDELKMLFNEKLMYNECEKNVLLM